MTATQVPVTPPSVGDVPIRVAAIQMVSGDDVQVNLGAAAEAIANAKAQGAQLVVLPEYFCLMGQREQDKMLIAEDPDSGPIQTFLAEQAKCRGVWLIGGTLPLRCGDPKRVFNTVLVYNPDGRCHARYDKIHLFAFQRGSESYDEARSIMHGTQPVVVEIPFAGLAQPLRVGLSVCYDLRFPELYRHMGQVDLHVIPAAFTATTGKAHWEVLLRARAIENLCYVLASAQGGTHANGRQTFGHSMLIDPWGQIHACLPTGAGYVIGDINPAFLTNCRNQLPALSHRVL